MKLFVGGFVIMMGFIVQVGIVRAEEQSVTLTVENMTCSLCPVTVRKALEKTDGVTKATVSYEQHRAVIIYDDKIIDIATLIETTTNAGFPSSLAKENGR